MTDTDNTVEQTNLLAAFQRAEASYVQAEAAVRKAEQMLDSAKESQRLAFQTYQSLKRVMEALS